MAAVHKDAQVIQWLNQQVTELGGHIPDLLRALPFEALAPLLLNTNKVEEVCALTKTAATQLHERWLKCALRPPTVPNVSQHETLDETVRGVAEEILKSGGVELLNRCIADCPRDAAGLLRKLRNHPNLIAELSDRRERPERPQAMCRNYKSLGVLIGKDDATSKDECIQLVTKMHTDYCSNFDPYCLVDIAEFEESLQKDSSDVLQACIRLREVFLEMTPEDDYQYDPSAPEHRFRFRIGSVPLRLDAIGPTPCRGQLSRATKAIIERVIQENSALIDFQNQNAALLTPQEFDASKPDSIAPTLMAHPHNVKLQTRGAEALLQLLNADAAHHLPFVRAALQGGLFRHFYTVTLTLSSANLEELVSKLLAVSLADVDPEFQRSVADAGGVGLLLRVLQDRRRAEVTSYACLALAMLCAKNDAIKVEIAQATGVQTLATVLSDHLQTPHVVYCACVALTNLASSNDSVVLGGDLQFLSLQLLHVMRASQSSYPPTFSQACECVWNILVRRPDISRTEHVKNQMSQLLFAAPPDVEFARRCLDFICASSR